MLLLYLILHCICFISSAAAAVVDHIIPSTGTDKYNNNNNNNRNRGRADGSSIHNNNNNQGSSNEEHQQQRRGLAEASYDGICYQDILTSSPDPNDSSANNNLTTTTQGLFFHIENTHLSNEIDISSLSIYLDTKLEFNFTISILNGEYVTRGTLGTVTNLGGTSWNVIANGTNVVTNDLSLDDDGASLIPFSSITVSPSAVMSFYLKFSNNALAVDDDSSLVGEVEDTSVTLSPEYSTSGLKMYVGRKDIFSAPAGQGLMPLVAVDFDRYFEPSRFVGRIWAKLSTCSPTKSPTPAPSSYPSDSPSYMPSFMPTPAPSASPTPAPTRLYTVTVVNNEFILVFDAGGGRMLTSSRSLFTWIRSSHSKRHLQAPDCLTASDLFLVESKLESHANNTYIQAGVQASYIDISITSYIDDSPSGDCSRIKFIFDQEIVFNSAADDETTVAEIIEMPLATSERQATYVEELKNSVSADSALTNVVSAEETEVTMQGLSTRSPTSSPSISTAPTGNPSNPPSLSPTQMPSFSTKPTISSAPSWSPTTQPSISISPTISVRPTGRPSSEPTISSAPTDVPSDGPSSQPTTTQAPSFSPSDVPSSSPTASPSDFPSSSPSTEFNYMTVEYSFDISYPADETSTEQIENDIAGNVTQSLMNILADPDDLLYPLSRTYGLDLSQQADGKTSWMYEVKNPVDCVNALENQGNVCKRFVIIVLFEHKRGISEGLVRGWLLEVSDHIMGSLKATYTGEEAVRSVQIMVLPDVEEYPENVDAVCEIVQEILANSTVIQESSYTILDVECLGFEIIYDLEPQTRGIFKNRQRGLRRLQQTVLGDANVEFRVTGEYTEAYRVEEVVKDNEFDLLLEDSINKDVGEDIGATLKERNIVAMKGTGVVTETKITLPPSQAPIEQAAFPSAVYAESSSNFASGTTGVAVIVTCALVVVLIGGFLFYMGIQRSKDEENDSFYWEDDSTGSSDYSPQDKQVKLDATMERGEDALVSFDDELSERSPEELPEYYHGNEANIFGETIGSTRNTVDNSGMLAAKRGLREQGESRKKLDAFDDRIQRKLDKRESQRDPSARDTLDEFDQRMQRKVNGQDDRQRGRSPAPSTFEQKLQKKLSGNENDVRRSSVDSQGSRSSFEQRLKRKMSEGSLSSRSPSPSQTASQGSVSSFEQRLKRKMSGGSLSRSTSPSQRSLHSSSSSRQLDDFEARISAKAKEGGDKGRSRSASPGSGRFTFDDRIKNKLSESKSIGSESSFEDRLRAKLNADSSHAGSRSPGPLASSINTSQRLDDLEARIAAKKREDSSDLPKTSLSYEQRLRNKMDKGSRLGNRSPSPSQRELVSTDSYRRLDNFEQRIASKSREGSRNPSPNTTYEDRLQKKLSKSGRSRSMPRALETSSSSKNLDSFEARILAKSKSNESSASRHSSRIPLSSSMTNMDSLEAKIQSKIREEESMNSRFDAAFSKSRSRNTLKDLAHSDEKATERIKYNEKLNKSRSRRKSPALMSTEPSMNPVSFEARIAAKKKEEEKKKYMPVSDISKSSRKLDDFEARIAAKSRSPSPNSSATSYEERLKKKMNDSYSVKSSNSQESASSSQFEQRMQQKLERNERSSKSAKKSDSFEEKLAQKMAHR